MNEIWKAIAGWEGFYEVSNLGRVRSLDRFVSNGRGGKRTVRARIMRPYPDRKVKPYLIVQLSRGGRIKVDAQFPLVHKLVLEAFIGPRPPGMEACHNNGDKLDNRASNLRWDTHLNNMADQYKHGTSNTRLYIEHDGLRLSLTEWSKRLGIDRKVLYSRIYQGETAPHCLRPVRPYRHAHL